MMDGEKSMVSVGQAQGAPQMGIAVVSADQYGFVEARIRADAQVRTALALARPRDLDVVRERLLKDARRPGFAEVAQYAIPRGGKTITGPSIRFAEACLRALGNVMVDVTIIHEDDQERAGEVVVCDLEANQVYRQGFVVRKVAERRKLPPNTRQEDIAGTRTGADGQTLYLVRLGETDILMAQNAITSRIIRTLALRLAPGDIVEEALATCLATQRSQDAQDPAAARKRIADAFGALGVSVSDLKAYLGHPLEQCSPAEMDLLRGHYAAMREGQATWAEIAAARATEAEAADRPANKAAAAVREKLAARKGGEGPQGQSPASTARWAGLAYLAPGRSREEIEAAAIGAVTAAGGPSDPGAWTETMWRAAEDAVKALGTRQPGEA